MLHGGFAPLMLLDRLIEKEALDKAFRIHSNESDRRGVKRLVSGSFSTYRTWDEAREAVNKAREEGKAAVFYDGATLPKVSEMPIKSEE